MVHNVIVNPGSVVVEVVNVNRHFPNFICRHYLNCISNGCKDRRFLWYTAACLKFCTASKFERDSVFRGEHSTTTATRAIRILTHLSRQAT